MCSVVFLVDGMHIVSSGLEVLIRGWRDVGPLTNTRVDNVHWLSHNDPKCIALESDGRFISLR